MAQIFISLGSNVNPMMSLSNGLKDLELVFGELVKSAVYESESLGFESHNFFNMVVSAYTDLSVEKVNDHLKQIEVINGRSLNSKKHAPHTLDLDLLLYDDLSANFPCQLPRSDITRFGFVIMPLAEIAADKSHPIEKLTYGEILSQFDFSSQKIWLADWQLLAS